MTHEYQSDDRRESRPEWRKPTVESYAIANTTLGKLGSLLDADNISVNYSPD